MRREFIQTLVRSLVAAGIGGLILLGCGGGSGGGSDSGGGDGGAGPGGSGSAYYPLAQGNTWQYTTTTPQGQTHGETYTVLSASPQSATVRFVSSTFSPGQYTNFNHQLNGADVYTTSLSYSCGNGLTYSPPVPIHLPDSSLGTNIAFTTTAQFKPPCWPTMSIAEYHESWVIGPETVSVPAGTFNTIRMEGTYAQNGVKLEYIVHYYAAGVGRIKSRYTSYPPTPYSLWTESNLVSHTVH